VTLEGVFARMHAHPSTEPFLLRGLYLQGLKSGIAGENVWNWSLSVGSVL